MHQRTHIAICFDMSRMVAEDQSNWLPMIPTGIFTGRDGRSWNNSDPDGVVAAFTMKLPFDVEHATETREGNTEAVGWIVELQNRSGEIWGRVEWNAEGSELIEGKKFGFYSPAFDYSPVDGRVVAMSSAGLTNKPNLYVPALNNQEDFTVKLPLILTQLLCLAEDATAEQAVTAINAMQAQNQIALNAQQDPTKFVPAATHQLALNRTQELEGKLAEIEQSKVDALVDAAITEGKVAPADKAMYVGLCSTEAGRQQFTAWCSRAPVIADASKVKTTTEQSGDLSKDELAMCRMMNVKPETWKATKAAQQAK
ncbi:phage protease [Aeromonas piscicola]|uniref:Phage protease n=1 Tax=Aeromonas piscicola TaxID=600645 RepID=A0ABT7QH34_9GAMM|nr:phage protease [Aeromonas piscicola]MDM5132919.1 phage protease [Aeromonas piscicola]